MANKPSLPAVALLLDSARGIYIPQTFVVSFDMSKWAGISAEDIATLTAGPDHEAYWETWDDVLKNATFTEDGNTWLLTQDGDLWAYCLALMTDDEKSNMGFDS